MKNNNYKRAIEYLIIWFFTIGFLIGIVYTSIYLWTHGYFSLFASLLFLIYILNLLAGIIIFNSGREAHSKLSWFIVNSLLPVVGPSLFMIFGLRFKGRMPLERYREYYSKTFLSQDFSVTKMCERSKVWKEKIMSELSNQVQRPIEKGNLKVLNSDEAFKSMFEEMRAAKQYLHIEFYIFKKGEIFEEFKSILIQKRKEGVEVRLIVDDFGRWALPWYLINELEKSGIEITVWGKVHFPFISSENGFRTHRKFVNIDGKVVYFGGINISDEYVHLSQKYGYWMDQQLRLEGPATRSYSILFINDWKFMAQKELDINKYAPNIDTNSNAQTIMIESGPDNTTSQSNDALTKLILSARKSIYLTTPYFVPSESLRLVLKIAALSGVDIKIIIPGLQDKKYMTYANRLFANELIQYGVKFYALKDMFLHTKMGIIDNEIAYGGTINLDVRSFFSQFEVFNIFIGNAVEESNNKFKKYEEYSVKISQKKHFKIKNKTTSFILKIFAPLM